MTNKLIGTAPSQVPTNSDLGDLAYQNYSSLLGNTRFGFKNLLINGDFKVSQRGNFTTDQTIGVNVTKVYVDRWAARTYGSGDATQTFVHNKNITLPNGIVTNSIKYTQNGTSNGTPFWHMIQAVEFEPWMCGKTFTFSYWYKTNSMGVKPRICDGATCVPINLVLNGDGEWHYATWSWNIPADAYVSNPSTIQFHPAFAKDVGNINGGEYFEFALCQMELGTVATPFEFRPYGAELALCQRYYQIHQGWMVGKYPSGTAECFMVFRPYVPMLKQPPAISISEHPLSVSRTVYHSGGSYVVSDSSTSYGWNSGSAQGLTQYGWIFHGQNSTLPQGACGYAPALTLQFDGDLV